MKRALVIDDEPYFRELLGRLLSREFQVSLAFDAESGRRVLGGEAQDVLLLDVYLPTTSSLEVLDGLQDDPRTSTLPVVALSAGRVEGVLRAALLRHVNVRCLLDKVASPGVFLEAARRAAAACRPVLLALAAALAASARASAGDLRFLDVNGREVPPVQGQALRFLGIDGKPVAAAGAGSEAERFRSESGEFDVLFMPGAREAVNAINEARRASFAWHKGIPVEMLPENEQATLRLDREEGVLRGVFKPRLPTGHAHWQYKLNPSGKTARVVASGRADGDPVLVLEEYDADGGLIARLIVGPWDIARETPAH